MASPTELRRWRLEAIQRRSTTPVWDQLAGNLVFGLAAVEFVFYCALSAIGNFFAEPFGEGDPNTPVLNDIARLWWPTFGVAVVGLVIWIWRGRLRQSIFWIALADFVLVTASSITLLVIVVNAVQNG